ncbi:hypothetical protein [Brevundimonas sp. GCM10030266]|uniref:hypothetical protein n=1 Tax=Brevundimonas sp. GCM10030266 TaxID=3273386 RepID=UPI00360967F5
MQKLDPYSRKALAVVAAFLCPGLFVALLSPILSPSDWNPGGLNIGVVDFIVAAAGHSLLGALFGSPVILMSFLIWAVLHRLELVRGWIFGLLGAILGALVVLLLTSDFDSVHWGFFRVFCAAGLFTGLIVWMIAYGWRRPVAASL